MSFRCRHKMSYVKFVKETPEIFSPLVIKQFSWAELDEEEKSDAIMKQERYKDMGSVCDPDCPKE